jgi:putative membrane protein
MWASAINAYLHYLGFMVSFAALGVELFHLKPNINLPDAKKVAFADAVYGLSATTILVTGILRVLYFGKGTDYYLHNPFFYVKISIFIIVSLLSLYPTFTFLFWFKDFRNEQTPTIDESKVHRISWMIKGELVGFIFIPLFASLMARMTHWY